MKISWNFSLQFFKNFMKFLKLSNMKFSTHISSLMRRQLHTPFRNLWAKTLFHIFSVTRLSVNYSRRSTKHTGVWSIFSRTLQRNATQWEFTAQSWVSMPHLDDKNILLNLNNLLKITPASASWNFYLIIIFHFLMVRSMCIE